MPGDTVYALSRRYKVSPQAIINANDMAPPYPLSVGQFVRIPSDAAANLAPAPAVRKSTSAKTITHTVAKGDTLYSIARRNGASVDAVAAANRLTPPYTLALGQKLTVPTNGTIAAPTPARNTQANKSADALIKKAAYTPDSQKDGFIWPVRGKILSEFGPKSDGRRNDGVNIAAPAGAPVRAAGDGEVVYRGSEIEGYGNLLLVKHDDGWVTAYAHNESMLVKKGQYVQQGEVIAKVGKSGSVDRPQLHFEMRRNLRAVDPLAELSK